MVLCSWRGLVRGSKYPVSGGLDFGGGELCCVLSSRECLGVTAMEKSLGCGSCLGAVVVVVEIGIEIGGLERCSKRWLLVAKGVFLDLFPWDTKTKKWPQGQVRVEGYSLYPPCRTSSPLLFLLSLLLLKTLVTTFSTFLACLRPCGTFLRSFYLPC